MFFNDVRDRRLTQNIEGPGGVPQSVLVNAGKTEVWGTELELNGTTTGNGTGGFGLALQRGRQVGATLTCKFGAD